MILFCSIIFIYVYSILPIYFIFRCCFRLLDVYGTQAMYRDPIYKETHLLQGARDAELLELKQYYTFYRKTALFLFMKLI